MFDLNYKTYPIGIDVTESSIKAVQLKKKGKAIKVQAVNRIEIPVGVIQAGEIAKHEIFSKSLENLLKKPVYGGFSGTDAVICMPESKSYLELIRVEKSPNRLEDVIEAELEKYIPLPPEEIYFDWQAASEDKSGFEILIGACGKKTVDSYIESVNSAGLSVCAIEIESIPIARAILTEESSQAKDPNKNYAIIDIGTLKTNLIIYSKNTIVMSVSLPISGEEITKKISKSLEIRPDQAEKAKIVCGLDKDIAKGIIRNILKGMISDLNEKIAGCFSFYADKYQDRGPINEILLCGGGANIIGIEEMISDALKVPVKRADVLVNVNGSENAAVIEKLSAIHKIDEAGIDSLSPVSSITQSDILSYATSIGLSLRGQITEK